MVECHGSQCGFCTPGFVMSLFALYEVQGGALAPADRRCARRQSLPLHRLRGRSSTPRGACASWPRGISSPSAKPRPSARCRRCSTTTGWPVQCRRATATSRRAAIDELAASGRAVSGCAACSPAAPTSACGSPSSIGDLETLIYLGRVRELRRLEVDGDASRDRRGRHLCRRASSSRRALSRLRRADPPARLGPDPQLPAPSAATSPTARRSATARRR